MARGGCKATDRKTINYSTFKVIGALIFLFFFYYKVVLSSFVMDTLEGNVLFLLSKRY